MWKEKRGSLFFIICRSTERPTEWTWKYTDGQTDQSTSVIEWILKYTDGQTDRLTYFSYRVDSKVNS